MSNQPKTIILIAGAEPHREGEYPIVYAVGNSITRGAQPITRIERREENLGTYGVVWFDVFVGDDLRASMNALLVAEISYSAKAEA